MTYNNLEWLLHVKLGFRASCFIQSIRLSKLAAKKWMKIDAHSRRWEWKRMNVVS